MAKLLVNNTGTWAYPEEVYVKQNNRWKSAREVWIKEGDEWKISWPNNTGTITYTEATFGVFQVPDGIYNIEVYWPTSSTYISSATLAVTPGSQISYQIGAYGDSSNFGGITTSRFNKEVAKFRGVVDHTLRQEFTVMVASSSTYSNYNDANGLDAGTLESNALAQSLYYNESNETKQGDKDANMSLTPVVLDDVLPGDYKIVFTEVNFAGGGTSSIAQQPAPSNNYRAIVDTYDPTGAAGDNNVHYYTLNLQQQTPVSIKWGDWS
jgi:hypothetical protein